MNYLQRIIGGRNRAMRVLCAFSILWLAACGDKSRGVTEPPPPKVASVTIDPDTSSIVLQGTARFAAIVRDSAGQILRGVTITWTSSDASVLTVDPSGTVAARNAGAARITATSGGISGQALVTVLRPPSDSAPARAADTTLVRVGAGSAVAIPAGFLPPDVKVHLAETSIPVPIEGTTQLGVALRLTFTVPARAVTTSGPLQGSAVSANALDLSGFRITIRTKVSGSIDRLSERAYLAINEAGNVGTRIVVKADNVLETVDQFGQRFVEATLIMPVGVASRFAVGRYDFIASALLIPQPVCNDGAWKLERVGLTAEDNAATSSPDRIPLILVHGWQAFSGTCGSVERYNPQSEAWAAMIARLRSDAALNRRFEVWVYRYPTFYSIMESSQRLGQLVSQRLAERDVVLAGHSMGGLVAAHYATNAGTTARALFALGTPFGGSPLARPPATNTTAAAAWETCTLGLATAPATILSYTVLTKDGVRQLDAGSEFLSALASKATLFAPRLRSFSGEIDWSTASLPTKLSYPPLISVGACSLNALGWPVTDGFVPSPSTRQGPGGSDLGTLQSVVFPGLSHTALPNAQAVLDALRVRLAAVGAQIPTAPRTMQLAGGNNQSGALGAILPQQISARIVDAAGVPVPNVIVTFAVMSGGGSVSPQTTTTNAGGLASTNWTLGIATGNQTATASAAGMQNSPVTFIAAAGVTPSFCPSQSYMIGTTVSGTIDSADCKFSPSPFGTGAYFESYEVSLPTPQAIRLSLTATFRPNVGVRGPFDLTFNYTHGLFAALGTTSITAKVLLPAGTITIRPSASSPNVTGSYTLSSAFTDVDVQNCEIALMVPGVRTQQRLTAADCTTGNTYADRFRIGLPVGARLIVEQSSSDFDSFLRLYKEGGTQVAFDDDSGAGLDAVLSYTSNDNVIYYIEATSFDSRTTGNYALRVTLAYPSSDAASSLTTGNLPGSTGEQK